MTAHTFEFRRATVQDCDRLNEITQSSSAYSGEYRAMLDGYEISQRQIQEDVYFVAEIAGCIVAYYGLIGNPEPELDLMFVSDEAQGTGIGRALFEHMVAVAENLNLDAVKIVSHPPTLGFYERMGAVRVGAQPPKGRVTWERPILSMAINPR